MASSNDTIQLTGRGAVNSQNLRELMEERGGKINNLPRPERLTFLLYAGTGRQTKVGTLAGKVSRRMRVRKPSVERRISELIKRGNFRIVK